MTTKMHPDRTRHTPNLQPRRASAPQPQPTCTQIAPTLHPRRTTGVLLRGHLAPKLHPGCSHPATLAWLIMPIGARRFDVHLRMSA